jgi:hypothetical protein
MKDLTEKTLYRINEIYTGFRIWARIRFLTCCVSRG